MDSLDNPLLIDPTLEEPWDFLFFDPDTGEITARWDTTTGEENPRGRALLDTLSSLRHQAVTEGRRKTFLRLQRSVRLFLGQSADNAGEVSERAVQDLLESVHDAMDYGIAVWFFLKDGGEEEPFRALRQRFPEAWSKAVESLSI